MKDDYLWDQTGEPDPEIERLENLLSRYRHAGKAPQMPVEATARPGYLRRLAIAAAIALMILAGLWIALHRQTSAPTADTFAKENQPAPAPVPQDANKPAQPVIEPSNMKASNAGPRRSQVRRPRREVPRPSAEDEPAALASSVAVIDFDIARHVERAQVLLRSFRNTEMPEGSGPVDLSFEKEQSRELLYKNILLRRDAEAKGNLPISDILGSLEPILLDIANLPENPSRDDIGLIKEIINKKEIVATLQVYSAPALSAVLR